MPAVTDFGCEPELGTTATRLRRSRRGPLEQFCSDNIDFTLISCRLKCNGGSVGAFRILVADDHPIFRFGLCSLLGSHQGWEVCGEAANGRDAVEKCKQLKPDLLILDICMPRLNGVDAARQILKCNPDQSILVLTAVDSDQVVRECLEAGVRGWVFKSEGADHLMTAVGAMQQRKIIFSSQVSDLILSAYRR